jgi:hypothetical protein
MTVDYDYTRDYEYDYDNDRLCMRTDHITSEWDISEGAMGMSMGMMVFTNDN